MSANTYLIVLTTIFATGFLVAVMILWQHRCPPQE